MQRRTWSTDRLSSTAARAREDSSKNAQRRPRRRASIGTYTWPPPKPAEASTSHQDWKKLKQVNVRSSQHFIDRLSSTVSKEKTDFSGNVQRRARRRASLGTHSCSSDCIAAKEGKDSSGSTQRRPRRRASISTHDRLSPKPAETTCNHKSKQADVISFLGIPKKFTNASDRNSMPQKLLGLVTPARVGGKKNFSLTAPMVANPRPGAPYTSTNPSGSRRSSRESSKIKMFWSARNAQNAVGDTIANSSGPQSISPTPPHSNNPRSLGITGILPFKAPQKSAKKKALAGETSLSPATSRRRRIELANSAIQSGNTRERKSQFRRRMSIPRRRMSMPGTLDHPEAQPTRKMSLSPKKASSANLMSRSNVISLPKMELADLRIRSGNTKVRKSQFRRRMSMPETLDYPTAEPIKRGLSPKIRRASLFLSTPKNNETSLPKVELADLRIQSGNTKVRKSQFRRRMSLPGTLDHLTVDPTTKMNTSPKTLSNKKDFEKEAVLLTPKTDATLPPENGFSTPTTSPTSVNEDIIVDGKNTLPKSSSRDATKSCPSDSENITTEGTTSDEPDSKESEPLVYDSAIAGASQESSFMEQNIKMPEFFTPTVQTLLPPKKKSRKRPHAGYRIRWGGPTTLDLSVYYPLIDIPEIDLPEKDDRFETSRSALHSVNDTIPMRPERSHSRDLSSNSSNCSGGGSADMDNVSPSSSSHSRPDIYMTPAEEDDGKEDAHDPKWKLKRVWRLGDMDEQEKERTVEREEVMPNVKDLCGVPEDFGLNAEENETPWVIQRLTFMHNEEMKCGDLEVFSDDEMTKKMEMITSNANLTRKYKKKASSDFEMAVGDDPVAAKQSKKSKSKSRHHKKKAEKRASKEAQKKAEKNIERKAQRKSERRTSKKFEKYTEKMALKKEVKKDAREASDRITMEEIEIEPIRTFVLPSGQKLLPPKVKKKGRRTNYQLRYDGPTVLSVHELFDIPEEDDRFLKTKNDASIPRPARRESWKAEPIVELGEHDEIPERPERFGSYGCIDELDDDGSEGELSLKDEGDNKPVSNFDRPQIVLTPTKMKTKKMRWLVRRVWDVLELDEREEDHSVSDKELMSKVQELFGVPDQVDLDDLKSESRFNDPFAKCDSAPFLLRRIYDIEGEIEEVETAVKFEVGDLKETIDHVNAEAEDIIMWYDLAPDNEAKPKPLSTNLVKTLKDPWFKSNLDDEDVLQKATPPRIVEKKEEDVFDDEDALQKAVPARILPWQNGSKIVEKKVEDLFNDEDALQKSAISRILPWQRRSKVVEKKKENTEEGDVKMWWDE